MTAFKDRTGDFTKKKHLYKFYKNGYTSRNPKYMTAGQYMGGTGTLLEGSTQGSAFVDGGVGENTISIFGNGDSNVGLSVKYRVDTDPRRKMDIGGVIASFSHNYGQSNLGSVSTYEIQLFDYIIRWTASGNTIKAFYKTTQLATATMAAGYSYIRMRELGGVFYIDRSSNGTTWTNWTSRTINPSTDMLQSVMSLQASLGAGGQGTASAYMQNIEATDRRGNLLAIESQVISDLEFTESIDNPASATMVSLPYNPLNVPTHCDQGNFVEIYTNFYDDGSIEYEEILDHNNSPILDHNSLPIQGAVINGNVPEEPTILKFSGYISSIDYDYDNETIQLRIVSHGETMANSLLRDGDISVPVISQLTYDLMATSVERRQTFTITRNTKIDSIMLRASYSGGGSSSVIFGKGNDTIGVTETKTWSGGFPESDIVYSLAQPLYLEAGVYWFRETGGVSIAIFNASRPYTGGHRQMILDGAWTNLESSTYFALYSLQLNTAFTLSGSSPIIADAIFEKSLKLDYSPLYLAEAEDNGYLININLNLDTAKTAISALHKQLPSGWFYSVDVGSGAVRIRSKNTDPDHLFVFGRDFTEMKVTKDIDGIVNDVYYVGAPLVENGPKLTVHSSDDESISDLRQGLQIISNDKVTRYDTAQTLSDNVVANNNIPRLTTDITLSAARYNIETIYSGDVVKIVNGDSDVLQATLVVATVKYIKGGDAVTISLDSAPRNVSRTIDAINRQLENMQTANAGIVL